MQAIQTIAGRLMVKGGPSAFITVDPEILVDLEEAR